MTKSGNNTVRGGFFRHNRSVARPLELARVGNERPKTIFVRSLADTGFGLHPRDKTIPFTPVLSGALLGESGYGSTLIETSLKPSHIRSTARLISGHKGVVVFEIGAGQSEYVREFLSLAAERPAHMVAYGVGANVHAGEVLREGLVDYCVTGEGEAVIPTLIPWLLKGAGNEPPVGLKWLENGVLRNSGAAALVNTDDMPFIPLEVLRSRRYCKASFPLSIGRPLRWGYILANRGCLFSCSFCTAMTRQSMDRKYRLCSPERLYREMKYQIEEGGCTIISVEDDLFTGNRDWTLEVCRLLESKRWKHPWIIQTRFDCLDEEVTSALKRAGCVGLTCGIESGSDRVLKNLGKRMTTDEIKRVGGMLASMGFSNRFTTMIGSPGERREDFEKTIALVRELNPLTVQMSFCTPYPDTDIATSGDCGSKMLRFQAPSRNLSEIDDRDLHDLRLSFYRCFYFSANYLRAHFREWLGYSFYNPVNTFRQARIFILFMAKQIISRPAAGRDHRKWCVPGKNKDRAHN